MSSLFKIGDSYKLQFGFAGRRRTLGCGRYAPAAKAMQGRVDALLELAETKTQPSGELRQWLDGLSSALKRKLTRWGLLDSLKVASTAPLMQHVNDYLDHCRHRGDSPNTIAEKVRHLTRLVKATAAERVADLTLDAAERHFADLKAMNLSARSINHRRQEGVAFLNWCIKTRRASSNPLADLPKLDEAQDRRRVRRALTDDELAKLLAVAGQRGRRAFYMLAALAGLRRGDLAGICWRDVDLEHATLTIRATVGKSRREDTLPLHPQLVEELRQMRPAFAVPSAKVFPQMVTSRTVQKDLIRAGLGRPVYKTDASGKAVLSKRGKPIAIGIDTTDAEGRIVDLHAMRTTLGTRLARAGVAPQLAQRIMRHSDYRTTQRHYTVLGLADTAKAVQALPAIPDAPEAGYGRLARTGTDDRDTASGEHLRPRAALGAACNRDKRAFASASDIADAVSGRVGDAAEVAGFADQNAGFGRESAKAGDRIRTGDVQLGKLAFYH